MLTRTSIRIFVLVALLAVAIPSYVTFVRPAPTGRGFDALNTVCLLSWYPALRITAAILPSSYIDMCCYDDSFELHRLRAVFLLGTALNVLFWTSACGLVLFSVRLARRARKVAQASNQAMERTAGSCDS
jgi:hypothetical protein